VVVDQAAATRTRLLALRAQLRLARQGRDVLDEKRNQLLKELRKLSDTVLAGTDALEQAAATASRTLGWAEALEGPEALGSAALAGRGEVFLEARTVSIVGVRVPEIERAAVGRPRTQRGYSLAATGPRVDAVAEAFEAELDLVVDIAAGEIRLRRIAKEVGTTTRRVNALEQVLIPRLEQALREITLTLEEREREEHFRLKRVKTRRSRAGGPRREAA
jgi:V/A-type H+-transporting ATPase subunit D